MARRPIEPQIKQDLTNRFSKRNAVLDTLLRIIIEQEGTDEGEGSSYDKVFGYGKFLKPGQPDPERNTPTANKPISKMTFKEVKEFGRALVNATKGKINRGQEGTSAVGAFQLLANEYNTNNPIVANFQKRLGYKDTDIFDEEAQRNIAKELIMEIAGTELNNYIENPSKRNSTLLITRIGKKGSPKNTTDGWDGVTRVDSIGNSTKNKTRLPFGTNAVEKLIETYDEELLDTKTTDDQMSDLGLSTDQSETQSNPNEDRLDDNVTRAMDKFRDILKDKETIKTLKQIQNARDLLDVVGTGPTSGVVNKLLKSKNIEKEVDKLDNNDTFSIYNYLRDAVNEIIGVKPAGASEKFNMDGIKTLQEKFKDMTASMGPVMDTSEDIKRRKLFSDPVYSEKAGSPDMIGDTSNIDAPLVSYGGDKVGTAPELQVSDIDNLEATQKIFEPDRPNISIDDQSGASRTDKPNYSIVGDIPMEDSDELGSGIVKSIPMEDADELGSGNVENIPMEDADELGSGIMESIPMEDADEIGSGDELDPERNREPRERSEQDFDYFADEAQPMGGEFEGDDIDAGSGPVDFSFIKSLFSGGFDAGRDSESELNIGADYFYDEAQPLGGEADPNDDVLRFDEGGTADFDGKKEEEDDEGDPPPLAKPEEVADDIPAMLSEGEYVLPANVVRYLGLERIIDMHRQVLSEIQQMEDLGMIQNVDKNGEPEEDDKEMKFLEPEEGKEAVSKGTLIIASSKPKGMMCPEPLKLREGSDVGAGDHSASPDDTTDTGPGPGNPNDATDEQEGKGNPDRDRASEKSETQTNPNERTSREVGTTTNPNEDRAKDPTTGLDPDAPGFGFAKSVRGIMQEGITDITGYNPPPSASRDREKSEKEASQPGDSEMELDGKIDDKDIKVNKVNDVIADLKNKNVYIPGVGYYPLPSLMSSEDTTIV